MAVEATLPVAAASVAVEGDVTVVGIGEGTLATGFDGGIGEGTLATGFDGGIGEGTLATGFDGGLPSGVSACFPYWGSRAELVDVVGLARQGPGRAGVHGGPCWSSTGEAAGSE